MTIDCILFYGGCDLDLLRLRLKEHSKFVDLFVISVCRFDFQDQQKYSYSIELEMLKTEWNIEIIYVSEWPAECNTPFLKANYWRNNLISSLTEFNDSDTILFTDLDEIVNSKKWNYTPDMGLMAVETKLYYYYLNLYSGGMWTNGFVAPYGFIKNKDITELRYNYSRNKYPTGLLQDAGWHFAWLGGKEVIKDKYRNFGQAEGWNPQLANDEYIDYILRERILFHNNQKLEIVSIDNSYPDELRFNTGKYLKYLYQFPEI